MICDRPGIFNTAVHYDNAQKHIVALLVNKYLVKGELCGNPVLNSGAAVVKCGERAKDCDGPTKGIVNNTVFNQWDQRPP